MPATKFTGETGVRNNAGLIEQLEKRFSPRGIRGRRMRRWQSLLWLVWVNAVVGAKRLFDWTAASLLIVITSPLLLLLFCVNLLRGDTVVSAPRLGRWGTVFEEYSFSSGFAQRLPALLNVWMGDMSLIGPRAIAPGTVSASERSAWKRFNIRPGLLCLWWVRLRTNIAYGTEAGSDVEYFETQSFMGDLGIALRALPAALYGGEEASAAPDVVELLGITIDNLTMDEAVETLACKARGPGAFQVCFVNADCANIAWEDDGYRKILSSSGLVLADGIGIKLAGRLLNRNIRQNVNGTDLVPRLCRVLEREGLSIYLLGGRPGVAEDVGRWMSSQFPSLNICGCRHGYFSPEETPEVLEAIRKSGAAVLLVAFGVPRQEQWISAHLQETGAMLSMGVGGLFDFYSGRIPRAPAWVREVGMEWFYRFWQEPRRMWRRYFVGNFVFLSRVLQERLRAGSL